MKTHQDLIQSYNSEHGKYPSLEQFSKWVEEKYLELLNNKITEKTKLFKENPVSIEGFWGFIDYNNNSIDFDDDPDGTEETW